MGLFDKKICSVCNKKAGMLRTTLCDGTYLCPDCAYDLIMPEKKDGANFYANFRLEDLDLKAVQALVEQRKRNQDNVKKFTCTKSLGDYFHIDMPNGMMVFTDKYNLRKNKITCGNPPIFFFDSLCLYHPIIVAAEEHSSFTGNVVECKINMVLGFNDPVYDIISVPIGIMKTKQGLFKTKTDMPPILEDALITCGEMREALNNWATEKGEYAAGAGKELLKKLVYRAKDLGILTADEALQALEEKH